MCRKARRTGIFDAMRAESLLDEIESEVAAKTGSRKVKGNRIKTRREAHTVRHEIGALEVTPRPPQHKGLKLPKVTFRALLAEETDPLAVAHQKKDYLTHLGRQCP